MLCTQLMKEFVAETSCSQLLLTESATYTVLKINFLVKEHKAGNIGLFLSHFRS